jgi:hypothetical protein
LERLDGHPAPQARVAGFIDEGQPAFPDPFVDFVMRQDLAADRRINA